MRKLLFLPISPVAITQLTLWLIVSILILIKVKIEIFGQPQTIWLLVTGLGKQKVLLGFPWLQKNNPLINWQTGTFVMISNPFLFPIHFYCALQSAWLVTYLFLLSFISLLIFTARLANHLDDSSLLPHSYHSLYYSAMIPLLYKPVG